MHRSIARRAAAAAVLIFVAAASYAQEPVPPLPQAPTATLSGQVRHAGSLKPIPEVPIIIEGTALVGVTDRDGRFSIANVPAGTHHVVIAHPGFVPLRPEVTIAAGTAPPVLDVLLSPSVHFTEVVSVSPDARDPFESYQPTTALGGQDLARQLEGTLGATLESQPGVAERSFGPGPSRPVIRGLDGDRVLILEDGQRVGDLSSQSGDHGVTVNPASSTRIEVVRGPATLLYGASAIGGLVNVISETIPTKKVTGARGGFTLDAASAASEFGTAADLTWGNGTWALNLGGAGRRSGDVDTPERTIDNTQSRGGFANLGASWTGEKRFVGASYGYDDTKYGIPFVEEGLIQLTPRRHMFGVKAGGTDLGGAIAGYRFSFASRRYRHNELEGDEVGTRFKNDTNELDLHVKHRPVGRLTGTIGGWFLDRRFEATGEEALSPPVKERGAALFLYEEVTWPHVTLQFGGRVNHATFDPAERLPSRAFTDISGSLGLLLRPKAANDRVTIAFSLARASRNPALEELYFFGPHLGNFAFEVGNSGLDSEAALGFDASLRWRAPRLHGEITYFRNTVDDFIFRNPISEEEFDERFGHEAHADEEGHGEGLPIVEFVAANSLLQGIEAHADVELGRGLGLELGLDFVRGELRGTKEPLPRMPPVRFRSGLRYTRNAFNSGIDLTAVARQDRVFGDETTTPGYNLVKLFASYSFGTARVVHTITARLDNATNELYQNHLSLIKDFVPEMGRNFKLIYSVRF
jgi:iron complex outermembrane receptor protein